MTNRFKHAAFCGLAAICFAGGFASTRSASATSAAATAPLVCDGVGTLSDSSGHLGCSIEARLFRQFAQDELVARVKRCCQPPAPAQPPPPPGMTLVELPAPDPDFAFAGFQFLDGDESTDRVTVITLVKRDSSDD